MKKTKELLNLYECAAKLKVPVGWLKQAAIEGTIPCLWLSKRKVRFNLSAVKKALIDLAQKRRTNQ